MALIHHGELSALVGRIIGRLLGGLGAAIGNFFSSVGSAVRNAATSLQNLVSTLLGAIAAWLVSAVGTIGSFFGWLYNHNRYWSALVLGIRTLVYSLIAWLGSSWSAVSSFIVLALATLQIRATIVWGAISSSTSTVGTLLLIDLHARWAAITSFVQGLAGAIWGAAQPVGQALLGPVQSLGGWLRDATTILVNNFVAGILSGLGAI